ncbi:MAG: type VI secretion system baseplate subunit TssK [Bryobacteraceae bacterium]
MRRLAPVVWTEGMHLGPHHFQAQARYFEDSIRFATSTLWFAAYGLAACELDGEAINNGTVSLIRARGIMPDGLAFEMPDCDPLPAARNIAELFPPLADKLTVCLGIPAYRPNAVNCVSPDAATSVEARYVSEQRIAPDENTGRDEKPVFFGRKNFRFCLENEITEDLVSLPIARVRRSGAGRFVYDADFIPPCLQIGSSERLMGILRRLIDILGEKSETFRRAPARGGEMATAFTQQEISTFWFLHCVNTSLARLRNLVLAKRGHPEEAFAELSRLAGALCTFGLDSHPASLPLYDHQRLEECFGALDSHIRFHLETVVPTSAVTIPLKPAADFFLEGEVADQRCLGRAQWIFSIRSRMGEADLIRLTPQLVKVCSKEFVPKLVQRALPGLPLTHLPVPPSAVAPRVERQYFALTRSGPCWEHIVKTREVGVYVPGEFPDPEIELQVILES